ncbi:hypothetical protein GUITHDRAFT_104565 [Guillardia theta CCMP2712]|uniref:Secreted protein n=1 Tax=Guillardia theta (strain CCMP2712) TaxID=905079 RepID=L1JMD2_GUITC|nr:hypothetical protein GUITHDRAFT_104565 [Guillardia theta CCMP2712]EKX49602.1 hypothetical protein GUITHDRAFT_104565 [Guillardia theta CCMP2712]|eukprot:XP_005836582.1 hypothetical protein GUITHDRAFT_104565 [Guillardia theta CCMP2712]
MYRMEQTRRTMMLFLLLSPSRSIAGLRLGKGSRQPASLSVLLLPSLLRAVEPSSLLPLCSILYRWKIKTFFEDKDASLDRLVLKLQHKHLAHLVRRWWLLCGEQRKIKRRIVVLLSSQGSRKSVELFLAWKALMVRKKRQQRMAGKISRSLTLENFMR